MLPSYYFDVEVEGALTPDHTGRVLDDDDAARAHAEAVLGAVERETTGSVVVYARRGDGQTVGAKLLVRAGTSV